MIELFELFNKINNLHSRYQTESQPRRSRQLTRIPRNYSIDHLGSKVLMLKDNSTNSTENGTTTEHSEQTPYRSTNNRLGTLWLRNPGSDSTGCLMLQDMIQVRGIHRAIWRLKTTRAPEVEKL